MTRSLTLAAVITIATAAAAQAGDFSNLLGHVNKAINSHHSFKKHGDLVNQVIRPGGGHTTLPVPPVVHPPVKPPVCKLPIVRPIVRPPVCPPIVHPPVRPPVCPPVVHPPVRPPVCPPIVHPPVRPPVCPPVIHPPVKPCPPVCPTPEPRPITYPITYPVPPQIEYGGCRYIEQLAAELEEQTKAFCLDLHYNYSHNYGFRETYAQAYYVFEVAKYIHGLEQYGDREGLRAQLQGLDTQFQNVQVQVRGWSRQPNQQVGEFGIFTKMEQIEQSIFRLMQDVGVSSQPGLGEPPAPVAYDNMPPRPERI